MDLAVVTMPGRETLPNTEFRYPTGVLEHSRARHALVIHYEDFFIPVLTSNRTLRDVKLIPSIAEATRPRSSKRSSTPFLMNLLARVSRPRRSRGCAKASSLCRFPARGWSCRQEPS